jgi:hypothetical protein
LFDSLLVFENYPIDRMVAAKGARLGICDLRDRRDEFSVTLIVTPGDMMELKLLHNRARLSDAEADRLRDRCRASSPAWQRTASGRSAICRWWIRRSTPD